MTKMRNLTVPVLALVVVAASAAHADLLPYGDPIQVTDDPAAVNYGVAAAVQLDGSFLVAWTRMMTYPNGYYDYEEVEQVFDVTGAPLGAPTVLDSAFGLSAPQARALPDGNYVIAWTESQGPWARIVDASGVPLGPPIALPGSPVDEAGSEPRLAALPHGFAAVWKHQMPAGVDASGDMQYSHIFLFRKFAEDGTPQGPSLTLTSPSPPSTGNPDFSVADIAALPNGGFIFVWSQDLSTAPPSTVQAMELDAQGFATSAATLAIDSAQFSGGMRPWVLVEADGTCEFLWMHSGILTVRRLGPGGLSPIFFSTAVALDLIGFEAATDQRGHLLVTAGTNDNSDSQDIPHGLWVLDDSGHYISGPITALTTVLVENSAVTANPGGTAVTAWLGNGTGDTGGHIDVFVRRFRSTCIPGGSQLCLGSNGRFALAADWQTPAGNQGPATPSPVVDDSGGFWFFTPSSVEVLAKIVDGRALNGAYWVLWGGMTNVAVNLRVTDTLQGLTRTYVNPLGEFPSMADVNAFPDASPPPAPRPPATQAAPAPRSAASPACTTTPATLCLQGRFQVGVSFENGTNPPGTGQAIPATDDSGYFWFFAPGDLEIAVKVLDGTAINGHFWVFAASLSNVQFAITLTDRLTGEVRVYDNPPGILRSFGDTAAF